MSTKRIEWIDIAKGIGMLLVIISHCVVLGGAVHNICFAFHMPLFFILSGLVFKKTPVKEMIVKRTNTLIVPYIEFCILGVIITLIFREFSLKPFIKNMILGNPDSIYVSSCWFLIALFVTSVMMSVILIIENKKIQIGIVLFLLFAGVVFARLYNHHVIPYRLPLDADVCLVALFFLYFGYLFKDKIIETMNKICKLNKVLVLLIMLLMTALFLITVKLNGTVNLHGITYRNPAFYIIESILGSFIVIFISMCLVNTKVSRFLIWFGKNNLYILCAQAIAVRLFIKIFNSIFVFKYALYGLPYKYAFISFIFTFVFSVLFVLLVNMIRTLKKSKKEV